MHEKKMKPVIKSDDCFGGDDNNYRKTLFRRRRTCEKKRAYYAPMIGLNPLKGEVLPLSFATWKSYGYRGWVFLNTRD